MKQTILNVIAFAVLLFSSAACGFPNPDRLEPSRKIGVGFRFQYWNYYVQVYKIEEGKYYFESVGTGYRDWIEPHIGEQELRQLLRECPQPDHHR